MELNWELCRIFYQVARCRNFSRAAAMLFTSQPAVSRSMAALERELGCRLFIRNQRGVELTPEGRMFYAHVEAGCEQFRRGREELEQAVGLQSGSIALGAQRAGPAPLAAAAAGPLPCPVSGGAAPAVRRYVPAGHR